MTQTFDDRTGGHGEQGDVEEFSRILGAYNSDIGMQVRLGLSSTHKAAEVVYMRLLNELYGWSLMNANVSSRNVLSVDLVDDINRIVVQITATCSRDKINAVLSSTRIAEYYERGYLLKIVFVGFQQDERRVKGYGANAWDIRDSYRGDFFDRHKDAIFTADLVARFMELTPDSRNRVLELVRDEIGVVYSASPIHKSETNEEDIIERINARIPRQQLHDLSFGTVNGEFVRIPVRIPYADRRVRNEDGKIANLREYVRDIWNANTQTHLVITGQAGMGKTVVLLRFATQPGFVPKVVPAVYIRLYELERYVVMGSDCIDMYLRQTFGPTEYATIVKRSNEPWRDGPRLLLLLDGHDEIPSEAAQRIDDDIRTWSLRMGTQLIIGSRVSGVLGMNNCRQLELQGLTRGEMSSFLNLRDIEQPNWQDDSLWQLLQTPLMLSLYSKVGPKTKELPFGISDSCVFDSAESRPSMRRFHVPLESCSVSLPSPKHEESKHPQDAGKDDASKYPQNAGKLVMSYLDHELTKLVDGEKKQRQKAEHILAALLIVPCVCWRMELEHEHRLSDKRLSAYTAEAVKFWDCKAMPSRITHAVDRLCSKSVVVKLKLHKGVQLAIIKKGIPWLAKVTDNEWSLTHPALRDALAAIHLDNVAQTSGSEMPDEYAHQISETVKDYLADLCDDGTLRRLWETNRCTRPNNVIKTHNLLRLAYAHYEGDLSQLNWSGMDLRGANLRVFRKGLRPLLSRDPHSFLDTKLDTSLFMPQGHVGGVNAVCITPDGLLVASGSDDGTVRLWDTFVGRQFGTPLKGHQDRVTSVCCNPDGQALVSGSQDGTVKLWNIATGKCVASYDSHGGGVYAVCFTPDGRTFATGTQDGIVRLWNVAEHEPIALLRGFGGRIRSVCFSHDGSRLASGSEDRTIRIWNVHTHELFLPNKCHDGPVTSVCFSPDDSAICSGSDDCTVRLWDASALWDARAPWGARTLKPIGDPIKSEGGWVTSVSFSADGSTVAAGLYDGCIRLWDTATRRRYGSLLEGHQGEVSSVAFSADGTTLVSGSTDGTVRLWNPVTGKQLESSIEGRANWVSSVCFSPDGMTLASGLSDGSIRTWGTKDGRQDGTLFGGHSSWVLSVCYSPSGSIIASGSADGDVRLWNVFTSHSTVMPNGHADWVSSVSFSLSNNLLASGSADGTIHLWQVPINHNRDVDYWLVLLSNDWFFTHDFLPHWESPKTIGPVPKTIGPVGSRVRSVCLTQDGSLLASGSADGVVRLWHLPEDGHPPVTLKTDGRGVRSVCLTQDGSLLASGSADGVVRLWHLPENGDPPITLRSDESGIRSVCLSQDGSFLASGSDNGAVRIWHMDGNNPKMTQLGEHDNGVASVCFSPDGSTIASCSDDGTIRLWDVSDLTGCEKGHDYFCGTIRPLFGVDISGLDFTMAIIDEDDREVFRQNGAKV